MAKLWYQQQSCLKAKVPKDLTRRKKLLWQTARLQAMQELERQLGHSVLSSANAKEPDLINESEKEKL